MKEEVNLRIEYDVDVLNNRCDRAAICKIRISAHPLMIERGRHLSIPRTERYCLLCKSNLKQFDMKEEVNLRIEYDLLSNKKLILLLAFL
jgi:hypothetical protein